MNLVNNIRYYRKMNNLTMKQLGNFIGVSEQAIGNYERGDRQVSISILTKMSKLFDVSLHDLVNNPKTPPEINNINSNDNYNFHIKRIISDLINDFLANQTIETNLNSLHTLIIKLLEIKYAGDSNKKITVEDLALELLLRTRGDTTNRFDKAEIKKLKNTIFNLTDNIITIIK